MHIDKNDYIFEPTTDVGKIMLSHTASSCLATMRVLSKDDSNFSYWHLPFYILAGTALELFAKLVILLQMEREGKNINDIRKVLQSYGHDLSKLYNKDTLGVRFMTNTRILDVSIVKYGNSVFNYSFKTEDSISMTVYDVESIRYGLLSEKKSNAGYIAYQTDNILQLCENIERSVNKEYFE